MALCESSNRRMRWQKQCRIVFFLFFLFLQCAVGRTNSKALKPSRVITKRSGGPDTSILELLKQKHDRAYLSADSEESMYLIIKCNTVTSYAKYVNISLI